MLALIAAVARDRAIGRGNDLLWLNPEDQRHFRQATLGCPVVMGRRTWDSLPARFRPLPGRRNIVLTRDPAWQAPGAEAVPSLDEALRVAGDVPKVFVIGGAQLYALALPRVDELVLTEIDAHFADADAHFPPWDPTAFTETSREHRTAPDGTGFDFATYRRKVLAAPIPAA